jgi:hypothetical protein
MSGPDFSVPWLKLIPVFLAFIGAAADLWLERKKKNLSRWRRYGLPALLVSTAVSSAAIAIDDARDTAQTRWETALEQQAAKKREVFFRKDAENVRRRSAAQLDRMEGKLGDEEATERFLRLTRQLVNQYNAATLPQSDALFDPHSERRKLREQVREANLRVLTAQKNRYDPVIYFVRSRLEKWIGDAKRRGEKIDPTIKEVPGIVVGRGQWDTALDVTFPDKTHFWLSVFPAIIEEGKVNGSCIIDFNLTLKGVGSFPLFGIRFQPTNLHISSHNGTRLPFEPYNGNPANPIEDEPVIKSLSRAVDETWAIIIEETR